MVGTAKKLPKVNIAIVGSSRKPYRPACTAEDMVDGKIEKNIVKG